MVGNALAKNSVHSGPSCTLQGFLINSGDIASAIWSFVIAVHTFFLLAGVHRWRSWVADKSTAGKGRWILCVGVWLFVLFIGVIGLILIEPLHPEKGPFCTPSINSVTNIRQSSGCWLVLDRQRILLGENLLSLSYPQLSISTNSSFLVH